MKDLTAFEYQLCDIQGRLFELSLKNGYDSAAFIKSFMNSKTAAALDDTYDRLQWAGEEYILEELIAEIGELPQTGKTFDNEVLFWAGYLYRYWHYATGENSKEIYKIATADLLNTTWLAFHTMDPKMAIEDLKEIYRQKDNQ